MKKNINQESRAKFDLLKTAIAHHLFIWIEPFGNDNGRTVRLFSYAMLIKRGFNVNVGGIINLKAVFCSDRNNYCKHLAQADTGEKSGILAWCEYVLRGLQEEIDKLLDYDYLAKEILVPTINHSLERTYITDIKADILRMAIENKIIQSSDLKEIFQGNHGAELSR